MGKILAICSGVGGCGKSTVALSLAIGAAKRGKQTILLDASGAARALDLMLGLESVVVLDMLDVARQQASIHTALYAVPGRANLCFACASLYDGVCVSELSGVLLALRAMCDVLVIDLPTGPVMIAEGVLDADDALIPVVRPDDASLRALERILGQMAHEPQRLLVINRMNAAWVKKGIQYDRRTVEMILDLPVAAQLAEEERVALFAKKGKAAIECDGRLAGEFSALLGSAL